MTTNPIVVLDDLTAYQSGDAQSLIDQATALVRRYCGWHITPSVTETVIIDALASDVQILPSLHVMAVTSVTCDGIVLAVEDYTWSPIGVLTFAPRGPYFSSCRRWPVGFGRVVVVMTHGYDEAPDVSAVILATASRAQKAPDGVTRSQVGSVSESYSQFAPNQAGGVVLLDAEKMVLDHYRLPPRP